MSTAAVPILMYHHVSPSPGLVTVSPENFRAQMRWLAEGGWRGVGLAELARFLAGEPLPDKSVVISFDDGWLDNRVHAHPVLAEFGLKAVLFLITGLLGEGPPRPCAGEGRTLPPTPDHGAGKAAVAAGRADEVMLRWSEAEAMAAAGSFEFHSHTHDHRRWDRAEPDRARRREGLAADLARSREALAARLGAATPHLCWPQGHYDDDHIDVARQAGFTHLYTTEPGTVDRRADPLRLPRIVTKDAPGWLGSRLWIYRRPALAAAYQALAGRR